MNDSGPRRPERSSFARRYGPILAIGAVLAVLAGLNVAGRDRGEADPGTPQTSAPGGGRRPVTFAEARDQGLDLDFGDRCDPATGRLRIPSNYAPPCVPVFTGSNGGATSKGVTADTIKVVNYIASTSGDLGALLQGIMDPPEASRQTERDDVAMLNSLYELYGRRVELVNVDASGGPDDAVAARADAVKVAEEIRPFASLGGPALTNAYADELAQRGVLCIGCGMTVPDTTYQDNAPYMWGNAATPEQFLVNLSDFVVNRLVNQPARFAGDPELAAKSRVFGVVHLEQDPPVFGEVERMTSAKGAERGWTSELIDTYTLDFAKAPERAATIIAHLKQAGVTTVVFLGDPLMPIYLTKQATQQGYFPEWIVTGVGFTDTSIFGRRYDQEQWRHAFGVSPLPVRLPREEGEAWRMSEWWYGRPPAATTTAPVIYAGMQLLFLGLHLAGPDLTPQSFRDGLFAAEPAGGLPTVPYVSFGDHGFYQLPDGNPRPDYLGVDDVTEIWWDPEATGPDESGAQGSGLWRYQDGGRRFLPGQIQPGPTRAFEPTGTVTSYDATTRPAQDRPPSYPAPPGAPSRGG